MQGLPASLPQAAELSRRRKLLGRSEDPGYTAGSGFDMSALQRKDDVISQCTQSVRCDSRVRDIDDAVVDIYAINLQLGAMAVCTGETSWCMKCEQHFQGTLWLVSDVKVDTPITVTLHHAKMTQIKHDHVSHLWICEHFRGTC